VSAYDKDPRVTYLGDECFHLADESRGFDSAFVSPSPLGGFFAFLRGEVPDEEDDFGTADEAIHSLIEDPQ
jgi:hypothetical protein